MTYYLNVTENGASRIHFSNFDKDITGLAIRNLTTCTGIVIVGDRGLVIIHDEGFLKIESIKEEFSFVGNLKQWSIFYNPNWLSGNELINRQEEMKSILDQYRAQYQGGEGHLFCAAERGELFVSRQEPRKINLNPEKGYLVKDPVNIKLRHVIRHLNNLCAHALEPQNKTHRIVPIDIQFNGDRQTEPPQLIFNDREKIQLFIKKTFNPSDDKETHDEYMDFLSQVSAEHFVLNDASFYKSNKPDPCEELDSADKKNGNENLPLPRYDNSK